jgi:hypothetical protein
MLERSGGGRLEVEAITGEDSGAPGSGRQVGRAGGPRGALHIADIA